MAVQFAAWTAATHCTGSATPGARAFAKVAQQLIPGLRNGGIYACRNVVGGNTTSCHGEGRAWDAMCSIPVGNVLVKAILRAGPARLGIQAIIHNRRIYSARTPGGRPYVGPGLNPHTDHVHIELTRAAGQKLTAATVRSVLGAALSVKPVILALGSTGEQVKALQRKLRVTADGTFGPATEKAVNDFKAAHGGPRDGRAGPNTFRLLGLS